MLQITMEGLHRKKLEIRYVKANLINQLCIEKCYSKILKKGK